MSIRINKEKCIGCGKCAAVCPGTLISVTDGKANMDYPRDCWGCAACVKECRFGAVEFFLGADIGGNGSFVTVEANENTMHWKLTKPDGSVHTIDTDRQSANQY